MQHQKIQSGLSGNAYKGRANETEHNCNAYDDEFCGVRGHSSEFHACAKRSRRSVSVFLELVHGHKAREEEDNEHHQEEKEEQHITRALGTPEGVLRHAVFRVYMLFLWSRGCPWFTRPPHRGPPPTRRPAPWGCCR